MERTKSPARYLLLAIVLTSGLILTNCSGGGGGTSGSKLGKNEYLGNLPALYDSYANKTDALKKKLEQEGEKLMAGGEKNYAKIQKLFDQKKVKEKELKREFEENVKAEIEKLSTKEIPVTFSNELKDSGMLFYNVSGVKLIYNMDEPQVSITITAKEDFTIPSMKAYDYTIYYRMMGSNGALEQSNACIIPVSLTREAKSFKKGDILNQSSAGFSLKRYAADRVAFSGIEFISREEYNAATGL